jgi:glutathione S-transferase
VSSPLALLTFAPTIDSETARLVCRHHGVEIDERDHLFGWVSILTLLHGGYGRLPLLHGQGVHLSGSWAIARHFDPAQPADRRLIPTEPPLAQHVAADWQTYNVGLGGNIAVFAYYHLLPEREVMAPIFAAPVPPREAALVPKVYGMLQGLFTHLLKLTPEHVRAATDSIRACFDLTDKRIAGGRRYLAGERLTMSDIGLAGASATLLVPRGYGAVMPPIEAMPPAMRDLVRELRARPTAAFVQAIYDGVLATAGA